CIISRRLVKDLPGNQPISLSQLVESSPTPLVGWNRVVLDPATAHILIKVVARINAAVHGGEIEAMDVGDLLRLILGRRRACGFILRSHTQHYPDRECGHKKDESHSCLEEYIETEWLFQNCPL